MCQDKRWGWKFGGTFRNMGSELGDGVLNMTRKRLSEPLRQGHEIYLFTY